MTAFLLLPLPLGAGVSVHRADSFGVVFRYEPGPVRLEKGISGEVSVEFPDADHLAQPGELDLPSKVVRIGIPQTGGVRLKVKTGPVETFDRIAVPLAVPCEEKGSRGRGAEGSSPRAPEPWNPGTLDFSGFVPGSVAEFGPVEQFRDIRVVEVRLSPVRYDPGARVLKVYDRIDIEVSFEEQPFSNSRPDPLDGPICRLLLNGDQALGWKLDQEQDRRNFFDRAPHWVKVRVCSTGIHSISGSDLEELGVGPAGIDPATLAMFTLGEHSLNGPYPDSMLEVPIFIEGEEDGRLDPDDRVVFYGLGANHWTNRCSVYVSNYYARHNVYWLAWGGGPGRRMARGLGPDTTGTRIVRTARSVLRQEHDLECPARSGLLWVWRTITKDSDREAASIDIDLGLDYPLKVERVSGRLFSGPKSSADHEIVAYLNHRPIDTLRFYAAPASSPFDFVVDTALPVNFSRNTVTLELRGQGGKKVFLDYLEVEYLRRLSLYSGQLRFLWDDTGTYRFSLRDVAGLPVILDVTEPWAPKMSDGFERDRDRVCFCRRVFRPAEFCVATPGQFLRPERIELRRPGRLTEPGLRADYWVVTPAEFLAPAQKFARYRAGRIPWIPYARVEVVTLEDIYDHYSFGVEEPGAIKWFFADKRSTYGLLVGDATYDYKNNLGRSKPPGVPAYEIGFSLDPSGVSGREALAYDAWYADFEGAGGTPDMVLGRVTSRTGVEFSRFVEKLIAYENGPAGMWSKRFILVADDEYLGRPDRPDPIGFKHIAQCERMAVLPGNLMNPVKVYLTEYPYAGIKNKPEAKAELLRQMSRGALLLVFFGHGDAFDLTHESVLNISQVGEIDNGSCAPFCYFGSCSVGRFEDTRYECIAEELVRKPDGGAIATIGATKATTAGPNEVFARNLLVPLFSYPDSTIGIAFFNAWPTDRTYHLFGDPATRLRLPAASTQELVVRPDTLQPAARFKVRSILEAPEAEFAWTLFGPWRTRTYVSNRGIAFYTLPGIELARGNGRIQEGRFFCQGVFPLGVPLDTVFVANGFYAPVQRSCRICASVWNDSVGLSTLRDTISYTPEPAVVEDRTGPEVGFWMDGRRLEHGAVVPASFELNGVVTDSAGIMIARVPGWTPRFFVNGREGEVNLADILLFDDSSSSTARFRVGVKLGGEFDTLWAEVYDNFLNRTLASVVVRSLSLEEPLAVDTVLVYPNPVKNEALFAFTLNHGAHVRVRIFTLQGRLVRDLGGPAVFGYNQLPWNGRDEQGNRLANGVYLFTLTARAGRAGRTETVTVRDRLLVMR